MLARLYSQRPILTARGGRRAGVELSLAALLLCSCSPHPRPAAPSSYQSALAASHSGNFAEACAQARSAITHCGADLQCQWKLKLLEADSLFQLERDAEAIALVSQVPPAGSEFKALDLRRRMLLGHILSYSRDKSKADSGLVLLDNAYAEAIHLNLVEVLPEMEILKARSLWNSKPDEAQALFQSARQHAREHHDEYEEAAALIDLGMFTLTRLARYDAAIPFLEQGLAAARRVNARPMASAAYTNLALCYTQLGDYDRALQFEKEGLVWLGASDSAVVRSHLLGETGRTYFLKGDPANAIEYYKKALDLANSSNDDKRRWTSNLASALSATGDWESAAKANREESGLARDDRSRAYANLNAAAIASGQKHYAEAVALYQKVIGLKAADPSLLWESHAGLARAYLSTGNKLLASSHFENAIDIIDKNQTGLSRDDYKLTFLASLIRFYQDYVEFLIENRNSEKALEIVESSRARILSEAIPQLKPGPRLTASQLQQAARSSGRVFVSYWLAPVQSYVWVILPTGTKYFPIGPASSIESLVESFDHSLPQLDIAVRESSVARRLSESLLGPVAPLIPPHAHVVIIPDGALHYLNFETLPVYSDKPRYWIEDATLLVAPSLAVAATAPPDTATRPGAALIIGDALAAPPDYPRLAYAEVEIDRVGARLGSPGTRIVKGPQATPAAYLSAHPQQFSIIHFSAHGEANPLSPLDSAIILSPNNGAFKLYARDVIEVPLKADLVTISACRSAGARVYSGEGLVGFVWAFLKAGARYVVAGLWDVTDSSTPEIMDRFYGSIENGQSPADALRSAKLAMIHTAKATHKPYYWGPFQMYVR